MIMRNFERFVKACLAVAYLNSIPLIKRVPYVFASLVAPMLSFIIILYAIGGIPMAIHALIGAVVASVTVVSMGLIRLSALLRLLGFQDTFLVNCVSPIVYVLGLLLSRLFMAMPAMVPVMLVLFLLAHADYLQILYTVLLVLLLLYIMAALSMGLALRLRDPLHADAIYMLLSTVLVYLPPVYYPAVLLPETLRPIVLVIPTALFAQLLRECLHISHVFNYKIYTIATLAHITIATILIKHYTKTLAEE